MRLFNDKHHRLRAMLACGLFFLPLLPATAAAKSPAVERPELEQAIHRASVVLVARVGSARETKIFTGGKAERVIRTFDFEPVQALKGIFVREVLPLTSEDLGVSPWYEAVESVWTPQPGELRLLLLGRSGTGYRNVHRQATLEQSLPLLESAADPFVKAVERLITVTQEHDRSRRVDLLLEGIGSANGVSALPLLDSLAYRAQLAAQHPGVTSVARLLGDPSPEVRTAAARTLGAILEADYLENGQLAEEATRALVGLLDTQDPLVAARVAAVDAIGAARSDAVAGIAAGQLRLGPDRSTWAERAAVVQAIGRQQVGSFTEQIRALVEELELDAPSGFQQAAQSALIELDAAGAARLIERRIGRKHRAGLEAALELRLAGELPAGEAVSVLTGVPVGELSRSERIAFAMACQQVKDERLVARLTGLLGPAQPDVHWNAVEALREIGTPRAAQAVRPYLAQEADLLRKLEVAAFLSRHGIDAGVPYALEHMSQAHLLEPSIAVLGAVSDRKAVDTLREIVRSSNDASWTGAAIRGLGALGDRTLAARLLEIVEDLRHPLAPYALVALGDLGEARSVEAFREGLGSRDDRIVAASVRGAAKLMARDAIDDEALRDEIAAMLASADASVPMRSAALDALHELDDPRLNAALAAAALDADLEGRPLLARIEEMAKDRKIRLANY